MTRTRHPWQGLLLGILLALAAFPVSAADYEGTYTVQSQSLTIQTRIALKLGTRSETVQTSRKLDIRGGQLPPETFAKEKDVWANRIMSMRLWPRQREIVAIASVNRAYDDLLARLNQQLRCFPERMTVQQAGVFSADLRLESARCSRTSTVRAGYDASKGTFKVTKLNPVELAFRPGWMALGAGGAKLSGNLAQGQMGWDVQALLLGTPQVGGAVTVDLGLKGTATLTRVSQ